MVKNSRTNFNHDFHEDVGYVDGFTLADVQIVTLEAVVTGFRLVKDN